MTGHGADVHRRPLQRPQALGVVVCPPLDDVLPELPAHAGKSPQGGANDDQVDEHEHDGLRQHLGLARWGTILDVNDAARELRQQKYDQVGGAHEQRKRRDAQGSVPPQHRI